MIGTGLAIPGIQKTGTDCKSCVKKFTWETYFGKISIIL